jgi:hypothetical protein
MSLPNCPLSYLCEDYVNGTPDRSEFVRTQHPCTQFIKGDCDMGAQVEIFIRTQRGEVVACSIDHIDKVMADLKK